MNEVETGIDQKRNLIKNITNEIKFVYDIKYDIKYKMTIV